jgi:hypothetical protein
MTSMQAGPGMRRLLTITLLVAAVSAAVWLLWTRLIEKQTIHAQASILTFPTQCNLPDGAAWVVARPKGGQPFNMAVYARGDQVADDIRTKGHYEISDTSQLTRKGKLFPKKVGFSRQVTLLDIGANIGSWTFFFAAEGHRVVAIEAMPSNRALINATLCANPRFAERIIVKAAILGVRILSWRRW